MIVSTRDDGADIASVPSLRFLTLAVAGNGEHPGRGLVEPGVIADAILIPDKTDFPLRLGRALFPKCAGARAYAPAQKYDEPNEPSPHRG